MKYIFYARLYGKKQKNKPMPLVLMLFHTWKIEFLNLPISFTVITQFSLKYVGHPLKNI